MGIFETATDPEPMWKVRALAQATGLTVRALHYYEQIGLLRPSQRSPAGHRLYDSADVARLYRISLLRRLGFPLDQITSVLNDPEWQLTGAVDRHLGHTQRRAASAARLCPRLAAMAAELARQENPSPEQLFSTLEEMTMLDGAIHSTTSLLVYDEITAAQDYIVRVFGLTPTMPAASRPEPRSSWNPSTSPTASASMAPAILKASSGSSTPPSPRNRAGPSIRAELAGPGPALAVPPVRRQLRAGPSGRARWSGRSPAPKPGGAAQPRRRTVRLRSSPGRTPRHPQICPRPRRPRRPWLGRLCPARRSRPRPGGLAASR